MDQTNTQQCPCVRLLRSIRYYFPAHRLCVPKSKRPFNLADNRRVGTDTVQDEIDRATAPFVTSFVVQVASHVTNQNVKPFGDFLRTCSLRSQHRQCGRIHFSHAGRSEEIVQEGDESLETITPRVREAQQVVDIVESVADFVSRPTRARQTGLSRIASVHELLELGTGVRGTQARRAGHFLRQHRRPSVRETMEHLSSLRRQRLDPGP